MNEFKLGQYSIFKVVAVESIGAFLDWGQPKDLFLPYAERNRVVRIGEDVVVYTYLDNNDRVTASMRLERNKAKTIEGLTEGQCVDLIVTDKTDLGFKVVVNQQTMGMIFHNEIFKPLRYGQKIQGYIKKIRVDDRLDLILQKPGHKAAVDDISPQIIELLNQSNGFLDINDKTDPERIYDLFGVSKKKYKIALGGLYKNRIITVHEDGIRLVKK
ncbi:MAG: GntR family transcriptional regulator [Bdellovibrionales bacterium]|nr:GntR family transcriptional regulator [Bdellovibrionales bacterium]